MSRTRYYEVMDARRKENWAIALDACESWAQDEPFSSRPMLTGSFIASALLGNNVFAAEIAIRGLVANPNNFLLRNNATVALAHQLRMTEAEQHFAQLNIPPADNENYPVYLATNGLLEFRRGNIESGRRLYHQAIELAVSRRKPQTALLALIYLVREEDRIQSPEAAHLVEIAAEGCGQIKDPELTRALNVVVPKSATSPLRSPAVIERINAQVRKAIEEFRGRIK